jgi:glycosyltransferase involved in cell wall biosynthesis
LDSIIRIGKFDIIHAHGHHYPSTWRAIASAAKYDIPSVLTLHGMYALNPGVLGGKTRLEMLFNKYVFKGILNKTTSVIGLTKQITKYAMELGGASTSYYTIANGVNTATYSENLKRKKEYRAKYNIPADNIVILFSGRFEHVKGVLEFANAVRNIVNTQGFKLQIFLVGAGTLEEDVRSILHGLDQAHVLSWQPIEKLHEIYIASDIFVIPSKFEALPITIIEAMNAGLHIVYTPVGGIPDILEEYAPKTVIRNSSSDEIESALIGILSDFPINMNNKKSMDYARKFDWRNIAVDVNKLYSEVAKGGRS